MDVEKGWEDEDALPVRRGLQTLMDGEPAFGTPTAPAVDDAVRRGRRRRIGRTVLSGAGVMVAAAAATVAVVQLRPAVVESPAFQPAAPPAAVTPAPSPTPVPDVSDPMADAPGYDELVPVVEQLAAVTGTEAEVSVIPRDAMGGNEDGSEYEPYAAMANVTLPDGGALSISVSVQQVEAGDDVVAVWGESCGLGAGDGKPCEELERTDTWGAWAFSYSSQAGREALRYAATASYGGLTVDVDNYTEQQGGEKVVGPSWSESGFTVEAIDQVMQGSGLLD